MSILVGLHHVTRYTYDRRSASDRRSCGCGRRRTRRTRIPSYSLKVTPAQHFVNWQQDPHGNWLARFVFPGKDHRIFGHGRSSRRHDGHQSVRLLRRAVRGKVAVLLSRRTSRGSCAYLEPEPAGPRLAAFARLDPARAAATPSTSSSSSISVCSTIVRYLVRMEPGVQTPEETLISAAGSCRDSRLAAGADPAPPRPRRRASSPAI